MVPGSDNEWGKEGPAYLQDQLRKQILMELQELLSSVEGCNSKRDHILMVLFRWSGRGGSVMRVSTGGISV